eukprot:c36458_g1_i1 orf=2-205(-)
MPRPLKQKLRTSFPWTNLDSNKDRNSPPKAAPVDSGGEEVTSALPTSTAQPGSGSLTSRQNGSVSSNS